MRTDRSLLPWLIGLLLLAGATVWLWWEYLHALHSFGVLDHVPTRSEFLAHYQTIWAAPWALLSAVSLGAVFVVFCLSMSRAGRWWGWPLLFLGEVLFVAATWWVFRIEVFALEQINLEQMAHMDNYRDMLSPRLLGGGVIFFFLSVLVYGGGQLARSRRLKASHTRNRNAALAPVDCPACGATHSFARCASGFAAGKVLQCSVCGHTAPLDVEGE